MDASTHRPLIVGALGTLSAVSLVSWAGWQFGLGSEFFCTVLIIVTVLCCLLCYHVSIKFRDILCKNQATIDELKLAKEAISKVNERLKRENYRIGNDVEVAKQIQLMILPGRYELRNVKGFEIEGFMYAADEVGGDYYDVLQADNYVRVGIGDITGHGIESGVLMLMVQTVARALIENGVRDLKIFLNTLNRVITKNIERIRVDKNLTLCFADFSNNTLKIVGQHENVLIIRADGTSEIIDTQDLGLPVGIEEDVSPFVQTRELAFHSGDMAIFYTDGITEAENEKNEQYGFAKLRETAVSLGKTGSATSVRDGIVRGVMTHIGRQKVNDDITLLVVKHI